MDHAEENRRTSERREHFRGSAKVRLRHLTFEQHPDVQSQPTFLDQKNVARLEKVFSIEGCLRLDPEHRVPVILDDKDLERSLREANVANGELFNAKIPPTLSFPHGYSLRCLHGRHRIAAAQKFLLAGDKWWIVDIYSEKLEKSLQRDLREEYSNSRNFCDGDIYRQIRNCQNNQDLLGAGRWLARLSEGKRKDFKQLHTREELKRLAEALDKLLPYVGFWPSLQIGTFHRVLNLKCPEELTHYLTHIKAYWDQIIEDDHAVRPLIDYGTVQRLQMRNPWASRIDKDFIVDSMKQETLFPLITDSRLRSQIKRNLLKQRCVIPSLYTFFEDTKWLEPCAKILRKLLPSGCKMSIRKSLLSNYGGPKMHPGKLIIQRDYKDVQYHQEGTEEEIVECGYRQLWLYAWRHFPELSAMLPRRDHGHTKPKARALCEKIWYNLADAAYWLGFESDSITHLRSRNADYEMAKEFLSQVRPAEFFWMTDKDRTDTIREICKALDAIEEATIDDTDISHSDFESEVIIDDRCGRPFEQSYRYTRTKFFLPAVYAAKERKVTHFSVNQDIFFAFFGADRPYRLEHVAANVQETNSETEGRPAQHDQHHQQESGGSCAGGSGPHQLEKGLTPGVAASQAISVTPRAVPHEQEISIQNEPAERPDTTGQLQRREVEAQDTDENQNMETQVIPYINPDLELSELYTNWILIEEGDILLVSITDASFSWINSRQAGSTRLPSAISSIAGHSFAWFDSTRKEFGTIDPENVFDYGKSSGYDGVVYHHPKLYPSGDGTYIDVEGSIMNEPLKGDTTKSRLYEIEQRCARKKRGRTRQKESGEPSQKKQDLRELRAIHPKEVKKAKAKEKQQM